LTLIKQRSDRRARFDALQYSDEAMPALGELTKGLEATLS